MAGRDGETHLKLIYKMDDRQVNHAKALEGLKTAIKGHDLQKIFHSNVCDIRSAACDN